MIAACAQVLQNAQSEEPQTLRDLVHAVCTPEQRERLSTLNLNFTPGRLPASTRLSEMKRVLREIMNTIFNIAVGDTHENHTALFDTLLASRWGKSFDDGKIAHVFENPIVQGLKKSYQVRVIYYST